MKRPTHRAHSPEHEIRPAPCERFGGCIHRDRCEAEKLACGAFAMYISGTSRKGMPTYWPTRERYIAIFEEDTDD